MTRIGAPCARSPVETDRRGLQRVIVTSLVKKIDLPAYRAFENGGKRNFSDSLGTRAPRGWIKLYIHIGIYIYGLVQEGPMSHFDEIQILIEIFFDYFYMLQNVQCI